MFPLRIRVQLLYYRRFGCFANLIRPVTFNEKLNHRKIFDRSSLLVTAADKLESKRFIKEEVPDLYVPETYWSGCDVGNICFDSLPDDYAFKANHTSQTIEFVRDGKHLSLRRMRTLIRSWLKHDQSISLGEWAYAGAERVAFIEEFLDFEGRSPDDYKFFVYHGNVRYIQVDYDRFNKHRRNMFNRNWDDLGIDYSHPRIIPAPPKPDFLSSMIEIAEKIGKHFDFIRVDLYRYRGTNAFGELTVYPGAGYERFPSTEWDIEFGKHWSINEHSVG